VTRYLIARGIAATRLRAIGYADTHPRASNTSVEGRARNRRVSLVLHMPAAAASASIRQGASDQASPDKAKSSQPPA
jgi:chemotaxis protein MotB